MGGVMADLAQAVGFDTPPTADELKVVGFDTPPTDDEIGQKRYPSPLAGLTPEDVQRAKAASGKGAPMPPNENLGVVPIDPHGQHIENVQKAAYDVSDEVLGKIQGFGGFVGGVERARADLHAAYALSPVLAGMAAQEPDRYAATAQQSAALEALLNGPPTPQEIAYYKANGLPVPQTVQHMGMLSMMLSRNFIRAGTEIYQVWSDLKDLTMRHPGPQHPEERASLSATKGNLDYLKELSQAPVPGEHTLIGKAVDLTTGFIPTAIELGLAPQAAFATLALHAYGGLRMSGVDPGWAMAGGLASGAFGSMLGTKFITGLVPKRAAQDAVGVIAQNMQRMFLKPSFGFAAKEFGTHAVSGYLMQVGMNASTQFASVMDRNTKTGRWPDVSEMKTIADRIFVDSLVALPFAVVGTANEFYHQRGRYLAARADNTLMQGISDLVNSSSDPRAATDHLQQVVSTRRTLRKLQDAAQVAEAYGSEVSPSFTRAANEKQAELRAMISAPAFGRAAQAMGISPEMLSRRILLNGKIGFSDAEILGIPLEAPIRAVAHELKDHIDEMSLHADVPSVKDAKPALKQAETDLKADYQERLQKAVGEQAKQEIIKEMGQILPEAAQESEPKPTPKPEESKSAPKPAQTALERDAATTVEQMPRDQLHSDVFKDQVKVARKEVKVKEGEAPDSAAIAKLERAVAAEAARKAAVKEYNKIATSIQKLADQKRRDAAYAGGRAYGAAYDAILNNDPQAFSDAFKQLPEGAFTVDHDDVLRAISYDNIDSASLADARTAQRALQEILGLAEEAHTTYVGGEARDREVVLDQIEKGMSSAPPPPGSKLAKVSAKAGELKADFDTARMTPHTLLNPYDEWGKDRMTWYLKTRLAEDVLVGRMVDLLKAPPEVRRLANDPITPPKANVPERALPKTRRDAWRVLLNTGNEEDLFRMSQRWGMSPAEIESWLRDDVKLTKPEYDHVQAWWTGLKEVMDIHAGNRAITGKAPMVRKTPRKIVTEHGEYTGGDAPFNWHEDTEARAEGEVRVMSAEARARRFAAPGQKAVLTSLLDQKSPDVRYDGLKGDVARLIHDATFGHFNRDTRQMINDRRFKEMTFSKLGESWYDRLTGWFDVAQRGSILPDAERTAWTDTLFGVGKHLAASVAFNLNVPVVLAQPSHFLAAGSRFGLANPLSWSEGLARSVTPTGHAEAAANSSVVPFRTNGYLRKWYQLMTEVAGKSGSVIDLGALPGLALQHGMDSFLTNAFWHTYKIDGIKRGLSVEEAERQADRRTDQSMPAISIMDQSALNRNRVFGAFVLVRNFPQAVWNLKAMDEWDTKAAVSAGRASFLGGFGGLAARRLGMLAGLGLGYYWMGHGRSPYEVELDRENFGSGTARWLARTAAPEAFLYNPILHEIVRALSEGMSEERFAVHNMHLFETPLEGLTSSIVSDIGKVRHAASYDEYQEMLFPALDAFGRATGLVSPGMIRSMRGTYKLLSMEDFPSLSLTGEYLLYGPDRKASNIFRDFGGER